MSDQQRVVDWLDDVLAWLREPLTELPVDRVLKRLETAFDLNHCCWYGQVGQVITEMVFDERQIAMDQYRETLAEFMDGRHRDCHPLTAWYARTLSTKPQTCARVPDGLVPRHRRHVLMDGMVKMGLEQQMTLYHRREGAISGFFVVARGGRDFDDGDLVLAGYVQRSLVTLDRQTRALQPGTEGLRPRTDLGLTGRQLAVLQLLSDGLSARQSARRLACSPRTVEKHLQSAYRKLEVSDRVNAIRVARLAGAVVEHPAPEAPMI